MNVRALVAVAALAVSALVAGGCGGDDDARNAATKPEVVQTDLARAMQRYIDDPAEGRRALEASLVVRTNRYATLRLERYDATHWGSLPELHVATTPLRADERGALAPRPRHADLGNTQATAEAADAWSALDTTPRTWTEDELRALGERAFFALPLQTSTTLPDAVADVDHGGVWTWEGRFGAVWASLPNQLVAAAFTCATCHASIAGGTLVAGRNNPDLDAARLYGGAAGGSAWPRGRVDVTDDGQDNPVAITDLRPIAYQENLHHAATLKNDPIALAVRVETLVITSHAETMRPPRAVAAGLAVYLLSLAPRAPLPTGRGSDVFARECASCHRGEGAVGSPVALATIGTDPRVGRSTERGTGTYRVPSLRAVGDRRRLLASGDVDDLTMLLDPGRTASGHRHGLSLDSNDRAALLSYLHAL